MFCLTRLGLCITLRWLYLLLHAMQFLGIPLRRDYRGFCILCHIRISHYDGFIQGCFKYLIVFALRCWTVSYYDTVSYVYYVISWTFP